MTTEARMVEATEAHAHALAVTLRAEDRAELEACGYPDVLAVLLDGVRSSDRCLAALWGDEVAAMIGVVDANSTVLGTSPVGQMWFLTGEAFAEHPRAFIKLATRAVGAMLDLYPVMGNIIDGRYTGALQLAAAVGARFSWPIAFGPRSMPFVPFTIRRSEAWVG